jgi:hypothetical protein
MRLWIPDPVGHRMIDKATPVQLSPLMIALGMTEENVIRTDSVMADDEWICDSCSDPIALKDAEGNALWVPIDEDLGGALCQQCMVRVLRSEPLLLVMYRAEPRDPGWWSRSLCTCPACVIVVERIQRGEPWNGPLTGTQA